jgi:nicotinic acid phosphoribosyltransferase
MIEENNKLEVKMSSYKITEITKLDIYNVYGVINAVLEKENEPPALYETTFTYGPGREEIIDLNGQKLFEYIEGLKLTWKLIEDSTPTPE